MITFTSTDVNNWCACFSATVALGDDWSGTAVDLLGEDVKVPEAADRIWAVMRTYLLPEAEIRRFAAWCASQVEQTDPRSIAALATAERLAQGIATESERFMAELEAWRAVEESPNATETALRTAAARAVYASAASAALNASMWAAADPDPKVKAERTAAQIAHAVEVFNLYGL